MNQISSAFALSLKLLAAGTVFLIPSAFAANLGPASTSQVDRDASQNDVLGTTEGFSPKIASISNPEDTLATPMRLTAKQIAITGNTAFDGAVLSAQLDDLLDVELSLADFNIAAERISAYYQERGYAAAHAYIPAQGINNGLVVIKVLEGTINATRIQNTSRLSDATVKSYLTDIGQGKLLRKQDINRILIRLINIPGVGASRAEFYPGAIPGTSDLIVDLEPSQPLTFATNVDNYGNDYTGITRADAKLAVNSPVGLGDVINVQLTTSGKGMNHGRLAYQVPIGGSGLMLAAAIAETRYQTGEVFESLSTHGMASSGSVYATFPLLLSSQSSLYSTLQYEEKKLVDLFVDQTEGPIYSTHKRVKVTTLGLSGSHEDEAGATDAQASTSFGLAFSAGHLDMDDESLKWDQGASAANTQGSFSKLSFSVNRQHGLGEQDYLWFSLQGQVASKNLNSSEKFALGGPTGVRAYPQGEASADQGWLMSFEWRHTLSEHVQGVLFYDAGSVDINHTPYGSAVNQAENRSNLSGAGVGVNAQWGSVQLRTSVAWPTGGGSSSGESAAFHKTPRLWLQLSAAM